MADSFSIIRAQWPRDHEAIIAIRTAVFVHEQGVPAELENDRADPGYFHLLALDSHGRPIGTARMRPDGHIGRVAVINEWRQRGVGRALLAELLGRARELQLAAVDLHSQINACTFYERLGFVPAGDPFLEANIRHLRMVRQLR